jgi:hypothetical protein
MPIPDPEKRKAPAGYRTESELASYVNKNERTVERWRKLRIGPPVTFLGKTPIYRNESTDAWLLAQEREQVREKTRKRRRMSASAELGA